MKQFWWKLCLICSVCVFAACSDDDTTEEEPEICPFTNAVLQQTTAKAGDVLTISGKGFAAAVNVYFRNDYGKSEAGGVKVSADGTEITFTLPDLDGGIYKVIVEQDGEWTLDELLTVEKDDTEITTNRKLLGFSFDNGMPGRVNVHLDFRLTYEGDNLVKVETADPQEEGNYLDYFVLDHSTPGTIQVRALMEVVDTALHQTGWQEYFTLVVDDNRVQKCFNPEETSEWQYTDRRYPKVVYNSLIRENGYTFSVSGNLSMWDMGNRGGRPTEFVYDNAENINRMGLDFGAFYAMMMVTGSEKTPELYAHIMRMAGRTSTLLPSGVKGRVNYEDTVFKFDYVTDAEGFVTEASSVQRVSYIDENYDNFTVNALRKITFIWE